MPCILKPLLVSCAHVSNWVALVWVLSHTLSLSLTHTLSLTSLVQLLEFDELLEYVAQTILERIGETQPPPWVPHPYTSSCV